MVCRKFKYAREIRGYLRQRRYERGGRGGAVEYEPPFFFFVFMYDETLEWGSGVDDGHISPLRFRSVCICRMAV